MIDIQLNSNDHLFIFIFLIALSFVAVGLHTETLLDSLLQCNNNEVNQWRLYLQRVPPGSRCIP